MATVYPGAIQNFPRAMNITETDSALVKQFQDAMEVGDIATANQILVQIPNYLNKIITADYLNTINDTVDAVEEEFKQRYNPSITISSVAPVNPNMNDYWWQVV